MEPPSTKPYLLRALHEWCCDNGFTPYISVFPDATARVPREFVRDGQITLNIGLEATGHLMIANEGISFQARFGGVPRELYVPIAEDPAEADSLPDDDPEPPVTPPAGRPRLQRVK